MERTNEETAKNGVNQGDLIKEFGEALPPKNGFNTECNISEEENNQQQIFFCL